MKRKVLKNDGSIPVDEILCTTYQMRNFYKQFKDGYFTDLDVMNLIQHYVAAKRAKKNWRIIDLCCGRGLMLPFLRYYSKDIKQYIGIDIHKPNMKFLEQRVTDGEEIDFDYYPFSVKAIESDAAKMSDHIDKNSIDMVIYTSAIEHMHKDHGEQSLRECAKVLKPGGELFLSCPNTPEDQDGFDVRYKAHVYEWKISELEEELAKNGFHITDMIGLSGSVRDLDHNLFMEPEVKRYYLKLRRYLPKEFLTPIFFVNHPRASDEILIIAHKL